MKKLKLAKKLRSNQTEAEQRLWYYLRAHRFHGLKFKRQKPVGPYIADFICMEKRLVIEVDGGQHNWQETRDQRRDAWFKTEGFKLLRFWNHEVMLDTDTVLERIRQAAERELPSPPTPLPQAGEGSG